MDIEENDVEVSWNSVEGMILQSAREVYTVMFNRSIKKRLGGMLKCQRKWMRKEMQIYNENNYYKKMKLIKLVCNVD